MINIGWNLSKISWKLVITEEKSYQALGHTFLDGSEFITHLRPNHRLLGVDLGTKTIGLALSDVLRTVASAYKTLSRSKFATDAQLLKNICQEYQITGLVLGGTYFSLEDFLGENATSSLMCYLKIKRLG